MQLLAYAFIVKPISGVNSTKLANYTRVLPNLTATEAGELDKATLAWQAR